jgi:hypothetical protein
MKNIFLKIFVSFIGLFIGLILFIIANIVFSPEKIDVDFDINQISDNKILGYELKRNFAYSDKMKTNSSGFRDREFSVVKDNNTKRILVLGDSITSAININNHENIFTSKFNDILNVNSKSFKYEVFNMGVDGYNTIQEAENLKQNGVKYNPDIVVVAYCLNDDDGYNSIYHAVLFNDNKLNSVLFKSVAYRKIYMFSVNIFSDIKVHGQPIQYIDDKYKNIDYKNIGFEMFKDLQREYKFKLYFFIVPYFKDFINYEDIKKHKEIVDRLKKYPEIKYFDLLDDFSKITSNGVVFRSHDPNDFCHPNEKGHELIAEFMYNKLKQNGALN